MLGLRLAFQGEKLSNFGRPDDVQVGKVMKKVFLDKVWAQSVEKVDFFQNLGLGLAIQGVKISAFDGPDDVQG